MGPLWWAEWDQVWASPDRSITATTMLTVTVVVIITVAVTIILIIKTHIITITTILTTLSLAIDDLGSGDSSSGFTADELCDAGYVS